MECTKDVEPPNDKPDESEVSEPPPPNPETAPAAPPASASTEPQGGHASSPAEEPVKQGAPAEDAPLVLHVSTMTKNEKDKVKRIVCPKATTGNLAVPKDIFELWQTDKGKEKLLNMWCKSGGVKAHGCLHQL